MGTVIQTHPQSHDDRKSHDDRTPRWDRTRRAHLFDQYLALQAQGLSLRQAAKALEVPRSTLCVYCSHSQALTALWAPPMAPSTR